MHQAPECIHRKVNSLAEAAVPRNSVPKAGGCIGGRRNVDIRTKAWNLSNMWNVEERFSAEGLEALPAKGFQVSNTRGVMRVEKYGCGAEFRRLPDGRFHMTVLPTVILNGQFTELWDAGYQKFLVTDDKRKFPALADQLVNMRRFNEELRSALGVPTYYNEALGSTCQITTYDRVRGRQGDVPDETVGIKTHSDH